MPSNWQNLRRVLVVADASPAIESMLTLLRRSLPTAEIVCVSFAELPQLNDRAFESAIVLTAPKQSPYPAAYRCYLAGIPIRVGQSIEFGGGVLSQCVEPLEDADPMTHHLHLLQAIGLSIPEEPDDVATANSHLARSR